MKLPKWIRKRLLTTIITSIGTTIILPFLMNMGVSEASAVEIVQWLIGLVGTYILGQSWSDGKLVETGKKDQ
jgi:hypothetical protein